MDEAERPDESTDHLRAVAAPHVRNLVLAGGGGLVLGWVGLLVGRAAGDGPHRFVAVVGDDPGPDRTVGLVGVTASLAWRRQSRSGPSRKLMQISTPATAREVGRALKLGQQLDERQREMAQATVDGWQRRRWVPWLFAIGACFYVAEAFDPPIRRSRPA